MTTKLCLQNSHVELLMITIHFIIVCVLCSYIDIHCNISLLINLWKFYRRHGVIEQFLCGRVLVWFWNMAHCHLWGAWLIAQCPKKSQALGLHSGLSFLMGYRVANKCESNGAWRALFLLLKGLLEQQYLFLCLLTITGSRNLSYRGSETNCQLVWWHCPPPEIKMEFMILDSLSGQRKHKGNSFFGSCKSLAWTKSIKWSRVHLM